MTTNQHAHGPTGEDLDSATLVSKLCYAVQAQTEGRAGSLSASRYKEEILRRLALADDARASTAAAGLPAVGSVWKHRNGNRYTVTSILNLHSERPLEFPVTVAYEDQDGKSWARVASRWHASMQPIEGRASD